MFLCRTDKFWVVLYCARPKHRLFVTVMSFLCKTVRLYANKRTQGAVVLYCNKTHGLFFYCNNLTFCVYCVTSNLIFCVFGFLFQDTVFIIKVRIFCTVMSFLCKNENTTKKACTVQKHYRLFSLGVFSFQKLICRRKFV